ncbi:GNAT family N-acetyltransferase [Dactylosporangium sp. McL0621]|uniref:GNAT family N-acetyltransferase n=1 Tax=Dactylosporangium sp. McL0621 TaxID=3415678 RepID=UPI003CFA8D13
MTDLHARPCRLDDAPAVAELVNTAIAAGGGRGEFAVSEFEDELRRCDHTRALFDPDGNMVAVGLVPRPPAGGDHVELIGGVHPAWRGRGLGRDLLAWQLERSAPWSAQVFATVGDEPAVALYERLGFTPMRYFLEMSAPTGGGPVPPGAAFDPARAEELYRVHCDAFRGLWGYQERTFDEWADATVRAASFRPDLARLALDGDAITAYVLPYDRGSLYIGQVGTAAQYRRRGIATALLTEVLSAAAGAGFERATLDADAANPTGAPSVYANAGFVVDQHVVVYRHEAPAVLT